MSRSIKKGPYINQKLEKRIEFGMLEDINKLALQG